MGQGRGLVELAEAAVDEAWLADAVTAVSRPSRDAQSAVVRLRVAQRLERVVQACRIEATREVGSLPFPQGAPVRASQFADLEIAVALNASQATGGTHRARAEQIAEHLPMTLQAIREGRIGEFHAIVLLEVTRDLPARDLLASAEPAIWARAGQHPSVPELRAAARHVLTRLDPHAFSRAHARERQAVNVRLRVEPDTAMGVLSAYLPLPDAVTVMNAVQARAEALRAAGDPAEGIGQLRAAALVELAGEYLSGRSGLPRPRAHGRPVQIHIAATVDTVFGLADCPGELLGYGPVPAPVVRELARDAKLRLLPIDPATGRPLRSPPAGTRNAGRGRYRPSAAHAADVAAVYPTSIAPGSRTPADRCDLDHHTPYQAGGPTTVANLFPLDERSHQAKTHGGWTYRIDPTTGEITWTTALGQTTRTRPYDYRLGP